MTSQQRLTAFFDKSKADSLPKIEWAIWWNLTIDRWHGENLDKKLNGKSLKHHFDLDYDHQIWIPNMIDGCPQLKEHGFISDEEEYEKIRPYLFNKEAIRSMKDMLEQAHNDYEQNGDITWFTLDGFFWFPRQLFGIEDHLYSFYDYPELYHKICSDMVDYYLFVIEELTKYISPQFMTFAEDMSYNLGPMLSQDTFNEFLLPYYKKIIPALKEKNIKVIVDSDGDITMMIPWLIEAGIEGILPLERQAGVDINILAKQYPDFYFVGGYDKMVMKFGEEEQRKEFERILPAMKMGNYLPSVDHQTPPDVSLENYKTYCKLLNEYCKKAI